jgi:lipopolysaccharide export LptBFGC system permease protein LptF
MNMGSRLAARSFGLAAAIALGLMFYVFSNASGMLAGGERLPPAYAAWLPILFFGGIAGFLLMHRESLH